MLWRNERANGFRSKGHCFGDTRVSTELVRAFATPQFHHATGELAAVEKANFRFICMDLLAIRSKDPSSIKSDLVPGEVLFEFARTQGDLTEIETAIACMYFSDICGELLAHRLLAEAEGRV